MAVEFGRRAVPGHVRPEFKELEEGLQGKAASRSSSCRSRTSPMQLLIQPIIIVKKKIVHGGHHGGAWKVAYADFVTAMMALFIVLWLLSSSDEVKKAVAGYFTRSHRARRPKLASGRADASENIGIGKDDMGKLKEKLEAAIRQSPELEQVQGSGPHDA